MPPWTTSWIRGPRRCLLAGIAALAVAGAVAAPVIAITGDGSGASQTPTLAHLEPLSPPPPALEERAAAAEALAEARRQIQPDSLTRAASASTRNGPVTLWAYRTRAGHEEVMLVRANGATSVSRCLDGPAALKVCGLESGTGQDIHVSGRVGPGVASVEVRYPGGDVVPAAMGPTGHWLAVLPGHTDVPAPVPEAVVARSASGETLAEGEFGIGGFIERGRRFQFEGYRP